MPDYLTVNGARLAYDTYGKSKNPALVLLHGPHSDRGTWHDVAEALAGEHRVYALDLRGQGESDRSEAYSEELMRDDVVAFARGLGLSRAGLIGHSTGATVAWLVAQSAPDLVDRLVVEDSPPDPQLSENLPSIEAPTLVLSGGAEGAARLREAAHRLPAAELVTIPVGHNIHRDAAETFVKVVRAFLAATR